MRVALIAGLDPIASTAAMVVRVLLVPAPTMSWAPRSVATADVTAITASFSAASSALVSPVVPSGTRPTAPASRYSWERRDNASSATEPSAANGVMSGT